MSSQYHFQFKLGGALTDLYKLNALATTVLINL